MTEETTREDLIGTNWWRKYPCCDIKPIRQSGVQLDVFGNVVAVVCKNCSISVCCAMCTLTTWELEEFYLGNRYVLPKPVMEWAGLDSPDPVTSEGGFSLTQLNDDEGYFDRIAKVVERDF